MSRLYQCNMVGVKSGTGSGFGSQNEVKVLSDGESSTYCSSVKTPGPSELSLVRLHFLAGGGLRCRLRAVTERFEQLRRSRTRLHGAGLKIRPIWVDDDIDPTSANPIFAGTRGDLKSRC